MSVQKSLAIALCLSLAAACSKDTGATDGGTDAGSNAYGLTVASGSSVLTMHPGDKKLLKVVLAQANVGAVPNASIHFEFDNEDSAGSQIDMQDTTTASDGTAGFNLTAGAKSTFKVIASAPDYPTVRPVAFSVQVVLVRKLLQIVSGPQVAVAHSGQNASVTMYKSSSVALKVQLLDQDTGNPIAGDTVAFQLGGTAQALSFTGGSSANSAAVTTGTAGTAQVFLVSGTVIQTGPQVSAQDAAGGVAAVTFSITVQDTATGTGCSTNAQCPADQICLNGACTPNEGGGGCTAGNDNGCPFGYQCVSGICQPPSDPMCDPNNPTATCPSGDTCICTGAQGAQSCQCQPICPVCMDGSTCVITGTTGTCVPTAGQPPDLTGVWYTKHSFSIIQALPSFVQGAQTVIRDLDQLIQGQFFSGFWAFLNPIVKGIIDQYVPAWVQTLIKVLDDIGTIFSNLRSLGSMKITSPGTDHTAFQGTEVWTSFVFYWLPLCNGNIGGNNYTPDCARFDVATTDATDPTTGVCGGQSTPSISVQVKPFAGHIVQNATTMKWSFNVADRQVSLKMGKLILVAINLLLSYLTPYECIEDALHCSPGNPCLIDCPAFGSFIESVTSGVLSASAGEAICDAAANIAGSALTNLIANITFTSDTLDFAGAAMVTADGSADGLCTLTNAGTCASKLGNDDYDNHLQVKDLKQDGWWTGDFFGVVGCTSGTPLGQGGCMPGAWEATRTQGQ
jgi:hypothetical protein